jgi:uncharacterized repeat protein (TIGR01451 family)
MKRLVLRFAALGTVVVLGLIAIAQAQRGSEDATPDADESVSAPGGAGNRLRQASPARPNENPLRRTDPRPAPSEFTPSEFSPAPSALITDRGEAAAPVDLTSAELFIGRPSAEPSRLGTDPGHQFAGEPLYPHDREAAVADVGRVVGPGGEPFAVSLPQTSPHALAPQNAHDPQAYDPPLRADSRLGTRFTPGAEPASAEGYSRLPADASDVREPGRFAADPNARPAGLSGPDLALPGNLTPPAFAAAMIDASPAGEGTGQPGNKQLEGPQSPQLTIQKTGPRAVQVGSAASFQVTVRNTGPVAAHQVEVRDEVPKGARLISTAPRASRGAGGELVWTLGTLRPGDESTVEIQLEPITEGEIGSVATVRFQANASARSVVTKPQLVVETSAPAQVLSGEQITLVIEVSNPGSGVAKGVVLEEHVPAGLQHSAGADLEYEVGDLPPGESRKLELTLVAGKAGLATNVLTARGQGNLRAEDRFDLEVIAPQLEVAVAGPKRRYLEREATYKLSILNPGSAPAKEVELVAYLSEGLKFVSANNSGHYEEASRTVHWRLEELPTDAMGVVELVALPIEAGQQTIRLHGTADRGVSADGEQAVLVEGIAAIKFEVVDVDDPIEVGGETVYEVRVVNQGSKAATNVRLVVLLPPEMRAVAGEGPTRHAVDGNRVLFEALPRLAPKADITYHIRVQGLRPGDLRVAVQLLTDDMRTPVTEEESTRVYSDE